MLISLINNACLQAYYYCFLDRPLLQAQKIDIDMTFQ